MQAKMYPQFSTDQLVSLSILRLIYLKKIYELYFFEFITYF